MSDPIGAYEPPHAALIRPESPHRRSWVGVMLGAVCLTGGIMGLSGFVGGAGGVILARQAGYFVDTPPGRIVVLLTGVMGVGTALMFLAARACFRCQWRPALAGAVPGAALIGGPVWLLTSHLSR